MTESFLGIAMGLLIGAGCRWFDIPLPAPPKFVGALLVVAMTVGFIGTDYLVRDFSATNRTGDISVSNSVTQ
ncbi:DUF1427 family protein [Sneathiella sp.]|uniref:DUF1427 family protein n=1 Tax=Sneathiella sp. TaxID=1964365 RepID=UPI0035623C00